MRDISKTHLWLWLVTVVLILSANARGQSDDSRYKDYKHSVYQQRYFGLSFDEKTITVMVYENGAAVSEAFPVDEIKKRSEAVVFSESIRLEGDGLVFRGQQYPYDRISDTRINETDDMISVTFLSRETRSPRVDRKRRGNRIEFDRDIVVEEDEFVRGVVLAVASSVEVYGEVNKDVVALFGDVYVGPGGVARGDIVSVTGRIDVAKDASVYGEIYSGAEGARVHKHRFYRREKAISFSGTFRYDRVDGAAPYLGFRFDDRDSILPSVWAIGGYAFNSERWRYDLGLEQTVWRSRPLAIGGSLYRRLASDDDWLLSDRENLVFTLLVTEDFKDYYEAEGGSVYAVFKPLADITLETRYRYEETKWLEGRPHLWSLLGGDKLFGLNFGRVESGFRQRGIAEMDTTANSCLSTTLEFDTRDTEDPFDRSAWHFRLNLEWSSPDLNSDFDYRRYTLILRRYQKLHRRVTLLLRGMYGGSDGYLPMYKRFYLGGLGTLRGYAHKELMGSEFWLANAEYRVDFPRTDLAVSVFWDAAQIANDTKLSGDIEVKHCLGAAVHFGDDMRVNVSRRLDRGYDDDPKIYVRFDHVF